MKSFRMTKDNKFMGPWKKDIINKQKYENLFLIFLYFNFRNYSITSFNRSS